MLRTIVPSAEVGSNFVYFCSSSLTWLEIVLDFHLVVISWSLSELTAYALPFEGPR